MFRKNKSIKRVSVQSKIESLTNYRQNLGKTWHNLNDEHKSTVFVEPKRNSFRVYKDMSKVERAMKDTDVQIEKLRNRELASLTKSKKGGEG
ncbi:MAG: hypothetical protein LBU60_05150 [Clostridiales bacterium]|nr:hypothetical protein [Clostridiales bacterium]